MKAEDCKTLLEKIKVKKNIIAKERDELNKIFDEIADFLDPLKSSIEDLDCGIGCISDAIKSISEVV